jgi:beta-glucosidase-like glycosyl hydrolase
MSFRGLIVTDAMEMKAIRNVYGDSEAARMAFEAGVDIVLMPPDVELAFEAIAASGVRRGIRTPRVFVNTQIDLRDLEQSHATLAMEVAQKSIELHGTLLLRDRELVVLTDPRPEVERKATSVIQNVGSIFKSVRRVSAGSALDVDDNSVLAVFHRARGYIDADATEWTIPRIMLDVAGRMSERGSTLAGLIMFGNPYLDRHFLMPPTFTLKTFSESAPSIAVASEKLLEAYNAQ